MWEYCSDNHEEWNAFEAVAMQFGAIAALAGIPQVCLAFKYDWCNKGIYAMPSDGSRKGQERSAGIGLSAAECILISRVGAFA